MADTQTASDFDPYASIRKRVLEQMPGGSVQAAGEAGAAVPQFDPSTSAPSPDFSSQSFAAPPAPAPNPTQDPRGEGGPPPPVAYPSSTNPYDQNDPRNQGTGGTYNQPSPGNDANQINGWYGAYLGRDPEPGAIEGKLAEMQQFGKTLSQIQNEIANSPEAMAYAKSKGFGQPAAPPAAAATGGGTTTAPGTAAVTATPTSQFTDTLRQILMQRLQSASTPVNENSQEIQAALQAARDEASRSSDQERTALAERLYAQGAASGGGGPLQSNALTQQIQQSSERTAGALAKVRASLLMNAYNQKFQELQDDLQLAFASGDAESARAIQIQLANLQATVQREGIGANLAINSSNQNANTVAAGAGR